MVTGPRPDRPVRVRVGVDLVGVERLQRLITEHAGMETAVFTERELAYCSGKRRRSEHLAARFAAKEAVLKAFGTGVSRRMRWTDVEILNDRQGRPVVRLDGAVAELAARRGLEDLDVSLTHTQDLAVANAVAVWAAPREGDPTEWGRPCGST